MAPRERGAGRRRLAPSRRSSRRRVLRDASRGERFGRRTRRARTRRSLRGLWRRVSGRWFAAVREPREHRRGRRGGGTSEEGGGDSGRAQVYGGRAGGDRGRGGGARAEGEGTRRAPRGDVNRIGNMIYPRRTRFFGGAGCSNAPPVSRAAPREPLSTHVPKRPIEMDAPAEQTMQEKTMCQTMMAGLPAKQHCEFWKEPWSSCVR